MTEQLLHTLRQSVCGEDLVLRFFFVFSRFEYALKQARILKDAKVAMPGGDAYAKSISSRLTSMSSKEFVNARSYLLLQPPARQLVKNQQGRWRNS